MYLRTTRRKNKDGSIVEYYQLAHNERHPDTRKPVARIIHSFGRADELDRDQLVRLCNSIARVCGLKVFDPLTAREIYKNKLIILCDQPDVNKLPRFNQFKANNSYLEENNQLFVLDVNGLEDYYPSNLECTYSSPRKKTKIAEWMCNEITQEGGCNEFCVN